MSKSPITCHVLDSTIGKPASGVPVVLEQLSGDGKFVVLASGSTDSNGRLSDLLPPSASPLPVGIYKMNFETGLYFTEKGMATFYPKVEILFNYENPEEHYHIPLLLSPHSYTTYRGS
ncbi:hypothetical protein BDY24DRAFT_207840 [Mrakia frigida]|uniref:hydroxyisourate hydrolase n=1 Tax=Mrakia frigida TaxID=29902 RepID=UPI003FCBF1F2